MSASPTIKTTIYQMDNTNYAWKRGDEVKLWIKKPQGRTNWTPRSI